MHVPEDAFTGEGGQHLTPERKAATALGNLFTMAATRVILDQFTGTRHRSPVYYKMVGVRGLNFLVTKKDVDVLLFMIFVND